MTTHRAFVEAWGDTDGDRLWHSRCMGRWAFRVRRQAKRDAALDRGRQEVRMRPGFASERAVAIRLTTDFAGALQRGCRVAARAPFACAPNATGERQTQDAWCPIFRQITP